MQNKSFVPTPELSCSVLFHVMTLCCREIFFSCGRVFFIISCNLSCVISLLLFSFIIPRMCSWCDVLCYAIIRNVRDLNGASIFLFETTEAFRSELNQGQGRKEQTSIHPPLFLLCSSTILLSPHLYPAYIISSIFSPSFHQFYLFNLSHLYVRDTLRMHVCFHEYLPDNSARHGTACIALF